MHADGIYFGLPAEEYHADEAIGSTGMKKLIVSPVEWWWQTPRNPLYKPQKMTPAMIMGAAMHALVLEGQDEFDRRFVKEITPADYPNALATTDELKAFLDSRGRNCKIKKADLIRQVLEEPNHPPIWQLVQERYAQENAGKTIMGEEEYEAVLLSSRMVTANPELAPAFEGGMPEVSVFWTVDGVRLKCRFDYLKIKSTIDLKSYAVKSAGRSIDSSIYQAIGAERYDVQGVHYGNGRMQIARFVEQGQVFGDHNPRWLKAVADCRDWKWVWIFYKTTGAPIARGKAFDPASTNWSNAQLEITKALEDYRACEAAFGNGIWIDRTPIDTIGEGDLPSWLGR